MSLKDKLHQLKLKYQGTKMEPLFNAFYTFLYTPSEVTKSGSHIRVVDDLKRTMNMVVLSLVPILIFSMFNTGYQHHLALGQVDYATDGFFSPNFWNFNNFIVGFKAVIPLVLVSYIVGLAVEFYFAMKKGHEVEEGYLVTGMLVPLIVPVDIPLWMLAVAVVFGVVIGKEVFGGTGMNILNPALTIRAFLFFSYPTWMSGDKVWIKGLTERTDGVTGETILGSLAQGKEYTYSIQEMFYGFIPGSVGETSTLLILLAGLFLIFTKIGSWRIMLSTVLGALAMGLIFNLIAPSMEGTKFFDLMNTPFWQHLLIGGFAFGAVFMATDPVTATQTTKGKWIYGFLIGFISILIRVFNPAYPEGVMLAILLMNVFAPTIDHIIVGKNIKKRLNRLKVKTA
jgi:Na+-transporting NADH:ubiquinone oxidoreductase subunit B